MLCRASAGGVRPPLPRCGTSAPASLSQNWAGCEAHEVRSRKDHRGVDLISDALPFGRLWYDTPDHAIGYAMHCSRSHDAVIRVYDAADNVTETRRERPARDDRSRVHLPFCRTEADWLPRSANWVSMIFSNSACGWAPLRKTPLMKNPGVPATPSLCPCPKSAWILETNLPLSRQDRNDFSSRFSVRACASRSAPFSLV